MDVFTWAVDEAVHGRRDSFAATVRSTFPGKQGQRMARMLGRLCALAQFFDTARVRPHVLDFREAMRRYATGEDLHDPDLDRGLALPHQLEHVTCKYCPTGLYRLAYYG